MDFEDEDIFEDDMDILEIIDFGFPRTIYTRNNYFQLLDDYTFFRRFRLYKETVYHLLTLIEHELEYPNDVNNSVTPINQILTCLRFFASGGHLNSVADFVGMDISTASRIIVRVSEAIARLYNRYIKFPEPNNIVQEQTKFYNVARFPRIIGVVDGTHIRIQSPGGDDPEIFRNRKGYFSVNVQVICNADLKLINVVARWPGSSHDATIFMNSAIRAQIEAGDFPNCVLIGDSGYPLKKYFLTPHPNPQTHGEILYNESLIRTRNMIERTIGIWKRRFPILAYGLRLKLETSLTTIIATSVLHNIAREMNEQEPPLPEEVNANEINYLIEMGQMLDLNIDHGVIHNTTQIARINDYFFNL
ncbi:hypothetical protein MML48_9g00013038 [Holotrichia oblita]|uniref:Uncharacterized protein n=1 Tax=Holotrichia oblita TaxID=644536 RepID=A0ACB9SJA0_HOLOL|nr:hypothetical protein MML48_9g00013038 [Holotrichia oblita]